MPGSAVGPAAFSRRNFTSALRSSLPGAEQPEHRGAAVFSATAGAGTIHLRKDDHLAWEWPSISPWMPLCGCPPAHRATALALERSRDDLPQHGRLVRSSTGRACDLHRAEVDVRQVERGRGAAGQPAEVTSTHRPRDGAGRLRWPACWRRSPRCCSTRVRRGPAKADAYSSGGICLGSCTTSSMPRLRASGGKDVTKLRLRTRLDSRRRSWAGLRPSPACAGGASGPSARRRRRSTTPPGRTSARLLGPSAAPMSGPRVPM